MAGLAVGHAGHLKKAIIDWQGVMDKMDHFIRGKICFDPVKGI
jgi:hypothetical protein